MILIANTNVHLDVGRNFRDNTIFLVRYSNYTLNDDGIHRKTRLKIDCSALVSETNSKVVIVRMINLLIQYTIMEYSFTNGGTNLFPNEVMNQMLDKTTVKINATKRQRTSIEVSVVNPNETVNQTGLNQDHDD